MMSDRGKQAQSERGGSLDFAEQRRRMVKNQLERRRVRDERVLKALGTVPREEFVPDVLRDRTYADCSLPIGLGQTISQPLTVALMLEALQLRGDETVLEIGTGSGYQAAALSLLVKKVVTVERIPELAEIARARLKRLGFDNVDVHLANGTLGLPELAPFDAIVVTAGGRELPAPYVDQVVDGGRILIPLGTSRNQQRMVRYTRIGDEVRAEDLGSFAFVPLIGEHGWKGREK